MNKVNFFVPLVAASYGDWGMAVSGDAARQ